MVISLRNNGLYDTIIFHFIFITCIYNSTHNNNNCGFILMIIQFVAEHNSNSVIKVQFLRIKQKAKSLNYFCTQLQYQFYEDEISRQQGLRTTPSNRKYRQ